MARCHHVAGGVAEEVWYDDPKAHKDNKDNAVPSFTLTSSGS